MQINTKKINSKKQFEPFTLTITIEKASEAEALHNVFNHGGLCDYLRDTASIIGQDFREALQRYNILKLGSWANFLSYFDRG